jgi:hypothetical protein
VNRLSVRIIAGSFVALLAVPVIDSDVASAATDGITMVEFDGVVQQGQTNISVHDLGPWTELMAPGGGTVRLFEAGRGDLKLGDHPDVQGYEPPADHDNSRSGLWAQAAGRETDACDEEYRRFVIDEVAYSNEVLDRLLVRVLTTCRYGDVRTHEMGVIAYHATAPVYAHDMYTPNEITAYLGRPSSGQINIDNTGTAPLVFSPAGVSGLDAASLRIVSDGCTAAPLQPGGRCSVKYAVTPLRSGHLVASVDVMSDFNRWSGQAENVAVTANVSATAPPPTVGDEIIQINPVRVLDTREANGVATAAPLDTTPVVVPIAGRLGIPEEATGVIANLTVTEPTTAGFVTVHPAGLPLPTVSNINFVAGDTVANLTTLALGADGAVEVFNSSGKTHVVLDVIAYLRHEPEFVNEPGLVYSAGNGPYRAADTRRDYPAHQGEEKLINLVTDSTRVTKALLINITAVDPTEPTFITAYAAGQPRPFTSSLNVRAGETRANLAIVGVDVLGNAVFYNNTGTTHLVIDVLGTFREGSSVGPGVTGRVLLMDPFRDLDTREEFGAFTAGEATGFRYPTSIDGVPIAGIMFNMTITEPTRAGFVTMFPWSLATVPLASNANFVPGQTVANHVWARLGAEPDNLIVVYNGSSGTMHVVLDIQAVFLR